MGSHITVCPPRRHKIPVVHVSRWETAFVLSAGTHTHTHTGPIQQAFSHLVCPHPSLHPPPALFMKACPLSAALSAPSCYGADYPHPESTSLLFFPFTPLSIHPLALSLLGGGGLTTLYCPPPHNLIMNETVHVR